MTTTSPKLQNHCAHGRTPPPPAELSRHFGNGVRHENTISAGDKHKCYFFVTDVLPVSLPSFRLDGGGRGVRMMGGVRGGVGASCEANQAPVLRGSQGERREIYFRETLAGKIFLPSAGYASRCGASTSPALRSHRSSARPSASRTSTSPARRLRPTKRSWPCLTSCGHASAFNRIQEGPLPQGGEGMRVLGSERWCSLAHKAAGLYGQREETPHQPPAPFSRGTRKCVPHKFSSGDGLGIQQPGSMTWGDRLAMPAPSGRARDRAICPAVARSSTMGCSSEVERVAVNRLVAGSNPAFPAKRI